MANPKWSEMKQMTDKDMRRRQKEREAQLALEREAREKVATRNKIVFVLIACVALACLVAAWFMVNGKRAEIEKIKQLSSLALRNADGTIGYREPGGVWTRESRPALLQGEAVSTVPDGRLEIDLHEGRSVLLFPGSEFVAREIKPLGTASSESPGVHVTAELNSGSAVVESRKPVGYVAVQASYLHVKANPRTVAHFKVEHRKNAGAVAMRVAVREGEVQVKFKDQPAIRLTDRQEITFAPDGKFDGPKAAALGNEAWR